MAELVAGPVDINATAINSAQAFGNAQLLPGAVLILPSSILSAEQHGTATIFNAEAIISPSSIASAEAFGMAAVLGGNSVIGWLKADVDVRAALIAGIELKPSITGQLELNRVH